MFVGMDPLETHRAALTAVAFGMLGTLADAEDAVQETYVRWMRLPDADRADIRSPGAWLTRVTGRICLDVLGSARARRERYVGEWLPEPVPADSSVAHAALDPYERVERSEAVSTALLLVLETLTPAERVVFVLHDVFAVSFDEIAAVIGRSAAACRQLASSARRRVRDGRRRAAARERHDTLVAAFVAACATGELAAVVAALDPDAVLRSDGGGVVSAARRPVHGADAVARFLLGLARKNPTARLEPVVTGDGAGVAIRDGDALLGVVTVGVSGEADADARITDVWIMRNPAKLRLWA
ncbi:RNA polymerase sigma-70 factor (ECF subfamily) [Microbacterium telephonicum]|uniref:RNA polymerase sigma-70 factor (ECF subfamily) n=2 Tax=Microbacterium telephonicum TaxID=1714841 RepID=A0A498BX00_9MICO|nr:RNA polymerase sigma-70 factor (ECF subfamily) [Microbacterium telephonicum]